MSIERIMQYECRVCGRKIDVTRTGDVYEEPVYCCGLEAAQTTTPEIPVGVRVEAPVVKKSAKKKAAKKPAKKKATKKPAKKKAAKKPAKKKATKKKAAKKKVAKKKAAKKKTKKRR